MNLGTLTVTLGVDATGLARAQTAMLSFTKTATTSMNTYAQRVRTIGYLTSAVLTLPIVAAGKASFKMAKDFEYSIQKIVGLTGTAQSVVNEWRNDIFKLSKELGKSPQELAEGLYFIASSGIKGADAMRVLELSAKAAASGLGETQDVANYLTSVLNAYRGTGLTAAYATDVLVAAVRVGKAEATGFASAMGSVIPIASKLGMSIDQVAGSMAAVTLTGSTAAQAATYLRGMLNVLMKETKQGVTAMDEASIALGTMKTSYADLRKILREQGIMALMEKLNTLSAAYGETLVAKVFPNIRAMLNVLSLSGKNMAYNSKIIKEVTESTGALGEAWAAVSNTIKVRFDRAISAAQVSIITLGKFVGEAFIPILEKLIEKLDKLTKWFTTLTEEQKKHILQWAAIVAIAGPAALLFSTLIYALSGLVSILGAVTKAWKFLNTEIIITRTLTNQTLFQKLISGFTMVKGEAIATAVQVTKALNVLKFGVFSAITIPLIIKLIGKIKDLKDQIIAAKAVLGYSDVGMELDVSIGKRMSLIKKLNQDELTLLKTDIAQRIVLEREKLLNAEGTGRKEIEQELFVLNKKKEIVAKNRNLEHLKNTQASSAADIKTWTESAKFFVEEANQAIHDYITNRMREVAYDKVAAQDTIDFYKKQGASVDKYIEKQVNLEETVTKATDEQTKALNRLEQAWLDARAAAQKYTAEEFLNLKTGGKKASLKPLGGLSLTPQSIGGEQRKVMDWLIEELSYINLKESTLNTTLGKNRDLYNEISAEIQAYSTALEGYLSIPLEERGASWTEGIGGIINSLVDLQDQFDKLETKKEIFSILANAATSFAFEIGNAIAGAQSFWKSFVDIILQTSAQIIGVLLSVAIAATIAKHAAMPWGLIGAAIAIGLLLALWEDSKAKVSATKMAEGGIVPPGYPNDTFPALLTSGERVIPAGLSSNMSEGRVVFEIHQDTLRGILNKANVRNALV